MFARITGRARDPHYKQHYGYGPAEDDVVAGEHPGLAIVRFLDNLPIVRVKPFMVSAEKHPETQSLKQVRIRTLSKKVGSADVARSYAQLLKDEGARWSGNNHGTFSYDCLSGYLELVVTEGTELTPYSIEGLGEDFCRHPAFHFPPPEIVEGVHEVMKAAFANRLDLYGKSPRKRLANSYPLLRPGRQGGARALGTGRR